MSSNTTPADEDESGQEDPNEILQEIERKRSLRGWGAIAVATIGIVFSLFQVWIAARGFVFYVPIPFTGTEYEIAGLQQLQINAIHVAFALVLAFLMFPVSSRDGFVFRTLSRVVPAARDRLGDDHAVTSALRRVRGGVRWAAADPDRDRITPVDYVLIGLALLSPIYMIGQFDEIRQARVRGLSIGRPIDEVYTFLEAPVAAVSALGFPLDETSYMFIVGVIGILLVLEATRRALGFFLMSLVSLFIVYARWGYVIPGDAPLIGTLSIGGVAWDTVVSYLWFTTEGIYGIPVIVSVRFIYIFILFGAFLEMSGAGKWFIDLAYGLTGTRQGGPAKASVVASGFMGMLSGSSVANTVTTGAFTIPLMKRSGYSPEFAGAVESSASSGGQVLPPVMGAAAFLIIEFTGTPYSEVIIAATLPAIAFFFGMWVMVHFEAVRQDIGGIARSNLVDIGTHLKSGWFYVLPLVLLLYFIIGARLSIARAGWYTIIVIIALVAVLAAYDERTRVPLVGSILAVFGIQAVSYAVVGGNVYDALTGGTGAGLAPTAALGAAVGDMGLIIVLISLLVILARPSMNGPLLDLDPSVDEAAERIDGSIGNRRIATSQPGRFVTFLLRSLDSGARTATTVVIAVAAAGVIPGIIGATGLGPNLNALIISVSGGSLLVLMLLAGITAIILGMGMPTTVMYVILVSMLGPALEDFGVAILAAHLFILYFGLMADVTPPVAVAAYAAAGIAKADEFSTGVTAFMLSLNKILVPFAFVLSPGILLLRTTDGEVSTIGTADILDLGFFVPEVVIPIVGMFAGVYALGIGIIGYYTEEVSDIDRTLFSLSSIAMMAPGLVLLTIQGIGRAMGVWLVLDTMTLDFALRGAGAVLLVALMFRNRGGVEEDERPTAGTTSAE
ncbi:TRAP transporter permease [Halalkalicoccus subterraneus]|uniref:TRAP transporter permease n=1 Tax=Halalkalicoccus subterraneus TaxID=2675002 RepID=UPI000EFAD68E|nr:TRAP transporter fused permease subunit [Halalkalicoccus subterraneus]